MGYMDFHFETLNSQEFIQLPLGDGLESPIKKDVDPMIKIKLNSMHETSK